MDPMPLWDHSLAEYPRLPHESTDEGRIRRALADCAGGVLCVPRGLYTVAEMITVDNACSLLLHKSAVLRAVREMPFVLTVDASAACPTPRYAWTRWTAASSGTT